MEERSRIRKTYHNPEPNTVACVAKCFAGVAIVGLIGVIGIAFNESVGEKFVGSPTPNARHAQAAQDPRRHEVGTQEPRQTQVEANDDLERPRHTVYRAAR